MATLESEIAFVVAYRCECCGASLEAPASRATAWLKCPACGRGGLPPELAVKRAAPAAPLVAGEELLVIGPPPEPKPMTPVGIAEHDSDWPDRAPATGNALRVACASVLFVSLTLLLFAYLEQNHLAASVCGAVAVLALAFLLITGHARQDD